MTTEAERLISTKLERSLNHKDLISLVHLYDTIRNDGTEATRNQKRTKRGLYEYLNQDLTKLSSFLDQLGFKDNDGNYGGPKAGETRRHVEE